MLLRATIPHEALPKATALRGLNPMSYRASSLFVLSARPSVYRS